jgi:hypothetical protein
MKASEARAAVKKYESDLRDITREVYDLIEYDSTRGVYATEYIVAPVYTRMLKSVSWQLIADGYNVCLQDSVLYINWKD